LKIKTGHVKFVLAFYWNVQ